LFGGLSAEQLDDLMEMVTTHGLTAATIATLAVLMMRYLGEKMSPVRFLTQGINPSLHLEGTHHCGPRCLPTLSRGRLRCGF
jgi:hypothetical protein